MILIDIHRRTGCLEERTRAVHGQCTLNHHLAVMTDFERTAVNDIQYAAFTDYKSAAFAVNRQDTAGVHRHRRCFGIRDSVRILRADPQSRSGKIRIDCQS